MCGGVVPEVAWMKEKEKMMKKLLIFMLVLGMTSTSFGVLTSVWFEVSGSSAIDAEALDVVTISMVADDAVGSIQIQVINDNGTGTALGTVQTAYGVHSNLSTGQLAGVGANSNNRLFQAHATNPLNSFQGGQGTGDAAPSGEDLLWFDYVVPDLTVGTVITITTFSVNDAFPPTMKNYVLGNEGSPTLTTIGSMDITIIPEPMTVLLLGLGGLFLRRRR